MVNVVSNGDVAFFERTAYKVKPPLPGTEPAGVVALDGHTPAPVGEGGQ